jgi:hypothetical protein
MGLLDNMDIEQEENIATNTREATDDLIDCEARNSRVMHK